MHALTKKKKEKKKRKQRTADQIDLNADIYMYLHYVPSNPVSVAWAWDRIVSARRRQAQNGKSTVPSHRKLHRLGRSPLCEGALHREDSSTRIYVSGVRQISTYAHTRKGTMRRSARAGLRRSDRRFSAPEPTMDVAPAVGRNRWLWWDRAHGTPGTLLKLLIPDGS